MNHDTDFENARASELAHSTPTHLLILANLISFFVFNLQQGFVLNAVPASKALTWGADFAPLTGRGDIWRLLSSLFLHANLEHLAANLIALFIVGRLVGSYFGWRNLFLIYFAGGIFGNLTSNILYPSAVSLGATGAIFSLYGALFAAKFNAQSTPTPRLTLSRYARAYLVYYIFRALMSGFQTSSLDNVAHLLGLIVGFGIASLIVELEWDGWRMAGASIAALFALILGMHLGFYPHLPSPKLIETRLHATHAVQEIGQIIHELASRMKTMGEAAEMVKAGKMSETDFILRTWKMELKPALQMLRNRAYRVKAPDQNTYAIQTEIYRSIVGYERLFTTLYEGTQQEATRAIASTSVDPKAHLQNAVDLIREFSMLQTKKPAQWPAFSELSP